MGKYRKKPVVIEAIQWIGDNFKEIETLNQKGSRNIQHVKSWDKVMNDTLLITTLEGEMRADKNDFIIKGINGELYPCKPDIFVATYEPVLY